MIRGTFAVDASLEVTGSYTQEETGALRLFVGGNDGADLGFSRNGGSYSQLFVGEAVTLDGTLEIVLQPELFAGFGYTPTVGDTFDFIVGEQGIALAEGLDYLFFVTADGMPLIEGLTFARYDSGLAADPDDLYLIAEQMFSFELVENDTVLRATLIADINVAAVPEPQTYALMLMGLALLGWLRRVKLERSIHNDGRA